MIQANEFVKQELIKTYQEIDGVQVIEDLLLFKGVEICSERGLGHVVSLKQLERMALVTYGLRHSKTTTLYVGMHLDKFYRRADLIHKIGEIIVPKEVYDRVKKLNDSYKTKDNQQDE